ncbi:hypothetical protein [Halobacillus naozhouensis]|uniref:Uncharacterized protein n=1 Tax=Halobacillus naozhouensis TaxID=554880 RepID=A0ABY8J6G6_9BACI|nr:hypothetical protein [Halobacillus naozhouensis]WFT76491.1 hypothetical protein P9989_09060 [Halobacillus naozhouensis]
MKKTVYASIKVKNISNETWETLVFFFTPNMFTEENFPHLKAPSTLEIDEVTLNGKEVEGSD